MIAFVHDRFDNAQDRFLAMLPQIEQVAQHAFRNEQPEARAELVQETVANCYVAFSRLVELGQVDRAFATPLAHFGIRQVRSGRRVGSKLNTGDVLSPANRRVVVQRLDHFDRQQEWKEVLIEDRHAGPAETACARLDLAQWFRSLPRRNRRIAQALAKGESTTGAARQFKVTAGRVSQLRRELEASWQKFQEEPVAA